MKKRTCFMFATLVVGLSTIIYQNRTSTQPDDVTGGRASVAVTETMFRSQETVNNSLQERIFTKSDARQPDFASIHEFRNWTERYLATAEESRPDLEQEGVALATKRRPEFQKLIRTNPQLALEAAIRPVQRQDLPATVVAQLEQPVSARGDFKAYFGRPAPGAVLPEGQELSMRYFELPTGESYQAYVYGGRRESVSKKDVALRGVAVGRDFAVHESPVRQLEAGERIAAGTEVDETCPVSEITTETKTEATLTVDDDTPVVELEGRLIRLCNGSHVRIFEEAQIMASGGPGVPGYFKDAYPGTSSEAIGNFRCLYIRVTYPDQMRAPNTEASAHSDMRNVSRFFLENSFSRLTTTTTVTPLLVLPHTKAWYIAKDTEVDGLGLVHSHSRAEARRLGFDSGQYNCTIVRVNEGPRLSGISWGGGDSVWVSWDGMDVLNHECGHSLGRNHANFWSTSDGSAIGLGENQEYGNSFDVMGGGGGFGAHYNSYSKRSLGWLPDPNIHRPSTTAASNGIYRIYAYDQPQLEEGKRYSLRVDKDPQRRFYFEYHPAIGGAWPNQMLMLMSGLGSNAGHLVDTTPGSDGGKGDGGIQIGRTFSDLESDMHFTVVGKNATTPPSMDLAMMRGPFPGNLPPAATLSANATTVAVNGSLTFTATATDPNGDALAYHWDFSDGYVAENAPVVTRNFTSADQQTVELTVSDMRGGTVRRNVVITIGNPGRAVIRGTILAGGLPLPGVRVTSDTDKYCFTDTDGNYALADLQAGSRTLSAMLAGYTFTADFANPQTITTAGATGMNWTAVSGTQLSLVASNAAEGGASGAFVLTRTGDLTDALTVNVAPVTGSAVKTTDFTMTPDYVTSGSMAAFTIPAGQASLTVVVPAVNDSAEEGPETVILQLAPGAYQVTGSGLVSLTIADNDTTKPVVRLAGVDAMATETAGDAGAFLISRTGSTTASLSVTVAYTGTATRGSDYPSLATSVMIPAGQASTTLALVPTDDAAIEVPEDAIVTLATNASYIVDPATNSGTVTITDNDLSIVSVNVLDDTLNEAGRGTGLVVLNRTGNLSQPLKVYYGLSGSAMHGADYASLPGEVTFAAGMASVPVVLAPYDDSHGEGDESITFNLTVFDNAYTLATNYSGTLTIKDNSDAPLVTVTANSAAEPSTAGTFTFTLVGSAAGNVIVNYTLSGTAAAGGDYTAPSGSVNIAGTSTASKGNTATVSIPIINDSLAENTETIVLTITPGAGYALYNDSSATMRIKDDDSESVAVSAHSGSLGEPNDASSFYFSRAGSTGDLTVNYTVSGSAANGTDFTTLPGTIIIPDGTSGVDLTVTPLDDTAAEGTETVVVTLLPAAGYGSEVPSAKLYLADNDLPSSLPSIGFASATGTTSEAPDPTTGEFRDIQITLGAVQTGVVTAEYIIGGGSAAGDNVDWSYVDAANANALIPSGVVTFPPGITSQNIRIRVNNDAYFEGTETAILELRNVTGMRLSGSRNKHTLTITDNAAAYPTPRVSLLVAATTRTEEDATEPMLIAALDVPSATAVTATYAVGGTATAGSDYTLAAGTLNFAAGEMFKKLPLSILIDSIAEPAETVVVTLTGATGATLGGILTHTVTISDNNAPILAVAVTTADAVEDSGTGMFTISRVGGAANLATTVKYAISGTAASVTDFTALSGTVLLPADQASVSITVVPVKDTVQESNKTVIMTLTADPNYELGPDTAATVTIVDDDNPPTVVLTAPTVSAVAIPTGVGLLVTVEATRDVPSGTIQAPVSWSQVSGPGTASFEAPSAASTGVTFSQGGSYVIRATSTHGATAVSADCAVSVVGNASAQSFSAVRFGNAPITSVFTYDAPTGVYNFSMGGTRIPSSSSPDQFLFAQQAVAGDCTIVARIVSIGTGGSATSDNRTGVMIRESNTDGSSPHAFMGITKTPATRFISRVTTGTASTSADGTGTFPCWVRLVRTGNAFVGATAPDVNGAPGTWTQVGNRTIAMPSAAFIGIAGASGSSSGSTLAPVVVDKVRILPFGTVSNLGPFVDAGAVLGGGGPWNLDATVTDDGLPLPSTLSTQWFSISGPASAIFGNNSSADTLVSFPASGNYQLRLTASDTQMTTFDDTTAVVTAIAPIESWRVSKFGADSSNPAMAGNLADFDNDGLTNLVEYALNSDPKSSVSSHLPVATIDEDFLSITYRLNLDATDVSMILEGSTILSGWLPVNDATLRTVSDDGHTRVVEAKVPATANRKFLRIKVTH